MCAGCISVRYLSYCTMPQGEIEKLVGISDESQDLVISNCVINLSPDKASVLREVYRVLAPGGEMYFSDVYCDRRLPKEVRMRYKQCRLRYRFVQLGSSRCRSDGGVCDA